MYRSLPRIRKQCSNSKKRKTGATGGTSKYYGNMVLGCLVIVFRPLLYEIYRSKLEKLLKYKLFQDLLKKMLKFVIFFFFNGLAAPKDIIQITSDHVGMLIRTCNNIWHCGYVKIQFFLSFHPNVHITARCHIAWCMGVEGGPLLDPIWWRETISSFVFLKLITQTGNFISGFWKMKLNLR